MCSCQSRQESRDHCQPTRASTLNVYAAHGCPPSVKTPAHNTLTCHGLRRNALRCMAVTRPASNCALPTLASAQQHPGRALLPLLQRLVRGICPSPDASEKLQASHTSTTVVASGARTPERSGVAHEHHCGGLGRADGRGRTPLRRTPERSGVLGTRAPLWWPRARARQRTPERSGVRRKGELDGTRSLLRHLLDGARELGGHGRDAAGNLGVELLL